MKSEKSVYSLDMIFDVECKDDKEINFVDRVFKDCLSLFQWHYQEALNKPKRDVLSAGEKATQKTIKLLRDCGQNTLADEVKQILIDGGIWTKQEIVTEVRKYMKEKLLMHYNIKKVMKKNTKSYKDKKISKEKYDEKVQLIQELIIIYPNFKITPSVYKNKWATQLLTAFIEWCNEHPLQEAPEHFDSSFEPLIY